MDKKKEKNGKRGKVENLIPRTSFPPGAQSKGAKAVNKMRAERRKAKALMEDILNLGIKADKIDLGELEGIARGLAHDQGGELSVYQAVLLAQAARAVMGDTTAATYCRDTAGDKPTDKQEISGTITEGDKALCAAVAARLDAGNNNACSGVDDRDEKKK